jgi:alkylation response protein AidB-like acyl-CoA dehydrogenase
MDFELTPEQKELEQEIDEYLGNLVTPEYEEEKLREPEGGSPEDAPEFCKIIKKLGKDGWLGIGWPKEYGGQDRSHIEQYIFFDTVFGKYRISIPMLTLNTVGPTIMEVGTEAQKELFLPKILKGDLNVAIGYTEPDSGSDLASLRTTAEKDGDYYVINGQKVYTSLAHFGHYIWLAARTDPNVKKHKGISIFMVDINTPGVSIDPMHFMGGFSSNATYYDNVRVHKDFLIGEENQGWIYINKQLSMERVTLVPHSYARVNLEKFTQWAKENTVDGEIVIEKPWVRNQLARLTMETEVLRMFNFHVAWMLSNGEFPISEALMTKVFGSELFQRINGFIVNAMGLRGQMEQGHDLAPVDGLFAREFVAKMLLTFGGGANEVLRDVIAMFGLGMPRSR